MRNRQQAQMHALDRVVDLLQEGSFKQLEEDSPVFTDIIEGLSAQVKYYTYELDSDNRRE
jgi:hypothetical protein